MQGARETMKAEAGSQRNEHHHQTKRIDIRQELMNNKCVVTACGDSRGECL